MNIAKMIASGVLGGGAGIDAPEFSSASVVVASPTIVEVCFSKIVQAAGDDFSTGVTITVNAAPVVITGGTLQTDEHYVRYVIPAVTVDDVVTWEYDAATGAIVGETDKPLEDVSEQTVLNLVGYLFKEDFTTADAAPIANPRVCEPGPGTLNITDSTSRFSIAGGKLVVAAGVTGACDAISPYKTNVSVGRAVICKVQKNGYIYFGYQEIDVDITPTGALATDAGGNALPESGYTDERVIAQVFRNPGYWLLDLTNNKLLYTSSYGSITNTNLYFGTNAQTATTIGGSCDYIYLKDLDAPWNTTDGPILDTEATPADGATLTAGADGQVEIYWTPAESGTIDIQVRRTDDDNCLIVRGAQAGTIKLFKKETGTEIELGTSSQTFTAGREYQIIILANAAGVYVYTRDTTFGRNFLKIAGSTAFNQTSTGAKVVCSGTIRAFSSWPRSISAPTFVANPAPLTYFSMGDSKTYAGTYQAVLTANLNTATTQPWTEVRNATNNVTLDTYANEIATRIASYAYIQDCPHVLVNLGINGGITAGEAATKADFQTIIDACVSRWPACKVYLTKIWNRATADADLNTFAGWIDDLVSANPTNVFVGIDERTVIEGGDDGATNTTDGTHYSAAGATAAAVAWQAVMGY